MPWGDPGVTEQNVISMLDDSIAIPSVQGGQGTTTLRRAGFLKRLRFFQTVTVNITTAFNGGPQRSAYGPVVGLIRRLRVEANGKVPVFDLSGLGLVVWNEVQNRDGTIMGRIPLTGDPNIPYASDIYVYPDVNGATGTFTTKAGIELVFALPVFVRGVANELGLWLLQNQAIDFGIEVQFNPVYQSTATNFALYSGGSGGVVALGSPAQLDIERETYDVPARPQDFPDVRWAHQVIEFTQPFTGGFARFEVPRAGLLLRAIVIATDTNGDLVELGDDDRIKMIYGANTTPIDRRNKFLKLEYLQDYLRLPPRGVMVLDFYKWGLDTLKLVKNTEVLANLVLEISTTQSAGTHRIILERLLPIEVGR